MAAVSSENIGPYFSISEINLKTKIQALVLNVQAIYLT